MYFLKLFLNKNHTSITHTHIYNIIKMQLKFNLYRYAICIMYVLIKLIYFLKITISWTRMRLLSTYSYFSLVIVSTQYTRNLLFHLKNHLLDTFRCMQPNKSRRRTSLHRVHRR